MWIMMSAAGSPVAPGIIRHLQKLGHLVVGHDCSPHGFGASICDEFHVSPRIDKAPQDYLDFLASFDDDCDLYLPFLDEELRLPDFNVVAGTNFTSPAKTLRIFTSKLKQQDAMEKAGLPVAPVASQWPYICKPDQGRGGKRNIRTDHGGLAELLDDSGWLVQKHIDGDEYTVDVLTDLDGKFLFAVPRLRVQTNGVSIVGIIVVGLRLIELAKEIVNAFHFRGPINIQMIRERDTGKVFIIEVNARLSGSCMFTVMAGWDILDATVRLAEGKPFVPPENVREITVRRHYEETIL